ncbi:amidohydrolase family protein [Deltaproteobacteria bacterium TL4]
MIYLSKTLAQLFEKNILYPYERPLSQLNSGTQKLIQSAFEGIDPQRMVDYHVHLLGVGSKNTGTFVHADIRQGFHPVQQLKFIIYAHATRVRNFERGDQDYVLRLIKLIRSMSPQGKYHILAFDKFYTPEGRADLSKTAFYVPNDYVVEVAERYPDLLLPVISVHPYRTDALSELDRWGKQGLKWVKWLPNSMGIDPSSSKLDAFYQKMKHYQMILLTHTGVEHAVNSEEHQEMGNPLLLRKPLNYGIRVIMAHCASLGKMADLDSPDRKKVSCFDLFIRMMEEKNYERHLFGDISGTTQTNRHPKVLRTLIDRYDLRHQLVNGSDYPIPAIKTLISTKKLELTGFITAQERKYLKEISQYNPLLFDFVVKRTVKYPRTKRKFAPSIFMANPLLED